jgi:glycosyltransferase involved in cell wall biosynthesis
MIYLGYFIVLFSATRWLTALTNLLSGRFRIKNSSEPDKLVSLLIPARNEERNIANILNDLLGQKYDKIEIIVFDDMSDDHTAEIVSRFSKTDHRVKLISSTGLPDGWHGKNFACHSLSQQARGDYLLFLDADVRAGNDLIGNALRYAEKHKLGLFSVFPKQLMFSRGEWSTVPAMNYILLTLLPLLLVRFSRFSSLAAANGQFMLFRADAYREYLPHQKFRSSRFEDIETARYFKRKRIRTACLAGNDSVRCRMYQGFEDAVNGFSKNVTGFFGNSFILAVLFWLVTTFGFLVVIFTTPAHILLLYLALAISARIMVSVTSGQNILKNLVFMIPQQIALGLFIYRAFTNQLKKQYEWKGRNIS